MSCYGTTPPCVYTLVDCAGKVPARPLPCVYGADVSSRRIRVCVTSSALRIVARSSARAALTSAATTAAWLSEAACPVSSLCVYVSVRPFACACSACAVHAQCMCSACAVHCAAHAQCICGACIQRNTHAVRTRPHLGEVGSISVAHECCRLARQQEHACVVRSAVRT